MAKLTLVESINKTLEQQMRKDKTVIILGEDVGIDGGVFRVTDGLIKKFPNQVFDTPIAESGILGGSLGMAVNGLKPIAEIQFSGFMYYAYHQIQSHIARIRLRSRGRFTAPLVIRVPYGGGIRALEHHSESFEAAYIQCSGIKFVVPSGPYNAKGLLASAIADPDPVIFFEPKKSYRAFREEVPDEEYKIPLGKADVTVTGTDITLIAWGSMMRPALRVAQKLSGKISCEVIDMMTLMPYDMDTVIKSVKKTGRAVVIHEAPRTCGLGGEIASQINERCVLDLKGPVQRVTGYDVPFPLFQLEDYYMPKEENIIKSINTVMRF
jgi:pyruvate dehydrogenase E1 component beta subunit